MVIKVYTSGISGNKDVKKRQQRIMMILDSKSIKYEVVDITEPGNEQEKQFMQENAEAKGLRNPLPPQLFNESEYCGDYDAFDLANENDELEEFLKLPIPTRVNGEPTTNKTPENFSSDKDSNHINYEIRHEEIIEKLVPETELNLDEDQLSHAESVHGYCFTPALAKRLLKLIEESLRRPNKETVHGYCFTPALTQRLTKSIAESYMISLGKYQSLQPDKLKQLNEDEEMEEEVEVIDDKVQEPVKKLLNEDEEMEEEVKEQEVRVINKQPPKTILNNPPIKKIEQVQEELKSIKIPEPTKQVIIEPVNKISPIEKENPVFINVVQSKIPETLDQSNVVKNEIQSKEMEVKPTQLFEPVKKIEIKQESIIKKEENVESKMLKEPLKQNEINGVEKIKQEAEMKVVKILEPIKPKQKDIELSRPPVIIQEVKEEIKPFKTQEPIKYRQIKEEKIVEEPVKMQEMMHVIHKQPNGVKEDEEGKKLKYFHTQESDSVKDVPDSELKESEVMVEGEE